MLIAIVAGLAMLVQDVLGTVMTQAESLSLGLPDLPKRSAYTSRGLWLVAFLRIYFHWRRWLAGTMDAMAWGVAITTTTISVQAFAGHSTSSKILVATFVTIANLVGTTVGQDIGRRFLRNKERPLTLEERVAMLETLRDHH